MVFGCETEASYRYVKQAGKSQYIALITHKFKHICPNHSLQRSDLFNAETWAGNMLLIITA